MKPGYERQSPPQELAGALAPFYRRARADSAVRWGLVAVEAWAISVCVLLAWSKLRPTNDVGLIAAVIGACALVIAGAAWAWRRPGLVQVARVADARLDLDERLASALCFAGAQGEMGARLRADAIEAASRRKPSEAFPLGKHRTLVATAIAAVLVAALLTLTPNPQASALARRAADRAALVQARKVIAAARRDLGSPSSGEARQIAAALQKALSDLQKASTPLAALVALSNLSRQLTNWNNSSVQVREAADTAAGQALAGAPELASLARALDNGDLQSAASDLRALSGQLPGLSPAQRKTLAAALAKAAAASDQVDTTQPGANRSGSVPSGEDGPFASALNKASSAIASGELGLARRALGAAAKGAAASGAAISLQQELGTLQAATQNEEAQVARQAQADTGTPGKAGSGNRDTTATGVAGAGAVTNSGSSGAPGANTGQGSTGGGGGSASAGSGAASSGAGSSGASNSGSGSSGGAGGGSGSGASGSGGTRSEGAGNGGEGGPGNGTESSRKTGGPATPPASTANQVFIAGQPGQGEQVVGQQVGNGGHVKTTSYQTVLPTFEKTALQDLGSNVVGANDQGLVRSYFSSLGNGK